MFRRLLVPVDGSPDPDTPLTVAQPLAEAFGAELTLARVVPTWMPGAADHLLLRDRAAVSRVDSKASSRLSRSAWEGPGR